MRQVYRYGLCILIVFGVVCAASAQEDWMPDPNLRQAVRNTLSLQSDETFTHADLLKLENLDLYRLKIRNLKGIEYAKNLRWFSFAENNVTDLSPLAMLTQLYTLYGWSNREFEDISPLANLTQLKVLNLGVCHIEDISPLANLRQLEKLVLYYNNISDIQPLRNLIQLTELRLANNKIVDISPLANLKNLTDLQIAGNAIRDFSPLLGLNLTNVDIDVRMLHELSSIEIEISDLNLERAVRTALELHDDVPLTQLVMYQLTGLEARDSQITDLTGLEFAINLIWLTLGGNQIRDLRPLAELTQLEALYIWNNPISDLSPLANLTTLKTLHMQACHISDISPLSNLTGLVNLHLYYNQIEDITPLANLLQLTELNLSNNYIVDISPLENLTILEELRIQNNSIIDFSPLGALSLVHFEYDEICVLPRIPISEQIHSRSFPSVFSAWYDILNRPALSYKERAAHHDLAIYSSPFGLHWLETNKGFQLVGDLNGAQQKRNALLALNPNMIFIRPINMRDDWPRKHPEDWPHWIRDAEGNRVSAKIYPAFLMDFTHPVVQDIIVQQALSIKQCGLYDGIFLDWWREDWIVLNGYRTYEEEQLARDVIIQRIRAEVGDNLLILVNPNRTKPVRAAPYINGLFMETVRDNAFGYTYNGLIEIESTLLWAEENLGSSPINCLEGWGVKTEAPDSPTNLRWMRVFTTMGLTHSNGYVLYITGIRHAIHVHDWHVFEITHKEEHDRSITHNHGHDHYWYDFWDADLGKPIGEKGQQYENQEGVFIREFTNGWAIYNRSGKEQEILLPEQATGVESGLRNTLHVVPDLDGEIYLKSTTDRHDVNGDGIVNILDLVAVANGLGTDAPDVNGDGVVNILDLVAVANALGQ